MNSITFNDKIYTRKIPFKGIYKITCKNTEKFYIGSSINIVRRFETHSQQLKRNAHDNPKLQNTYNKYGPDCLIYEIVAEGTSEDYRDLLVLEKFYLDTLLPEINIRTETDCPPRVVTKVQKYSHEGIFIKEYESAVSAARELGRESCNIFAVLSGARRQAFGFLWTSVDNPPDNIGPLQINLSGTKGVSEFWNNGEYKILKKDIVTGEILHTYTRLASVLEDLMVCRQNVMSHLSGRTKTCAGFILECEEFAYVKSFKGGTLRQTIKLSVDGLHLETFPSAASAARSVGVDKSAILNAIKGKFKSAGFYWKYS